MRKLLHDQSLTIVTLGLFLLFLSAQAFTGHRVYNADQQEHQESTVSFAAYLRSGHFVEATFENWESEFLQMGAFVLLTVYLVQRGSAESRDPDLPLESEEDESLTDDSPSAAKKTGVVRWAYENSLAVTLVRHFYRLLPHPCLGRSHGVQRGAGSSWREPSDHVQVHAHLSVLVRIIPELAERIPGGGRAGGPVDFPATARLTRVETGQRAAFQHRRMIGRGWTCSRNPP